MLSLQTTVLLLAIWVVWLVVLGWIVKRYQSGQTSDDYVAAGRQVHWGLVCTSVVAAYIWSATLMASAEGAYGFGAAGIWVYGIGYGSGLAAFGIAAGRLRSIFPRGTTVHQFVRLRFDTKTQVFWALLGIAFSFVTVMIQLIGAGIAIETFTGGKLPFWIGPTMVSAAVLVYILGAGLWSSIVADFIMVFVAIIAAIFLAPWTISSAGGLGAIFDAFQARVAAEGAYQMANFFRPDAMLNYLVPVLAWSWLALWLQQEYWQKAFSADPKLIRRSYVVAGFWWAMIPMAAAVVGLAGWALKVQVSVASDIYPKMVATYLPGWVQILFLLMIFAAVTSTVASSYLAVATVVVNDFYRTFFNPGVRPQDLKRYVQMAIIVVAIVATILSLFKVSILSLLLFMSLLLSAPAPTMILGMFNSRLTPNSAFSSSVVAMAVGLYIYFGTTAGLGWSIIAAASTSLVLSLIFSSIWNYNFDFRPLKEIKGFGLDQ